MHVSTRAALRPSPLTVGGHVDGSSDWDRRPPLCDGQDLHGLPLRPPLAVAAQHGRVHPLPGGVC